MEVITVLIDLSRHIIAMKRRPITEQGDVRTSFVSMLAPIAVLMRQDRQDNISLESQISSCVEEINEVLEELRCYLVEEEY